MSSLLNWGSDEARAKRNAQKVGFNANQTNETSRRWNERFAKDEQLAREMGVDIKYDDVRQHNTSLWRT